MKEENCRQQEAPVDQTISSETPEMPPFTKSLSSLASIAAASWNRPTATSISESQTPKVKSTVLPSVRRLEPTLLLSSESRHPAQLSITPIPPSKPRRFLDFDIETVAAGFADPQWVPNRTICWAYCWTDSSDVEVSSLPVKDFYDHEARKAFLQPLFDTIAEADVLTGHNIVRFDLPVLNAECLLLGLPTIGIKLIQDTIKLPKSKGFKKGQDNMGYALGVREEKMPLSWAQWEAAYAEPGLKTVKERCASDVLMHIQLRQKMLERGILEPPRTWRG